MPLFMAYFMALRMAVNMALFQKDTHNESSSKVWFVLVLPESRT